MRRSSWPSWLGMGMLVAAAKANGGDGGPRASRERARERGRGANEVSTGSGRRHGDHPGVQGRGRQAGGAMASSRMPTSPPCLPGGDEAAGWHGPAQRWAARWAGWWVAAR